MAPIMKNIPNTLRKKIIVMAAKEGTVAESAKEKQYEALMMIREAINMLIEVVMNG